MKSATTEDYSVVQGGMSRMARRISARSLSSRKKSPVAMTQTSVNGGGEIVLYEAPDGEIRLDVRLQQDTIWLTQTQMAELFEKNVRTISEHIGNVFKDKELDDSLVIRNFRITARDGKTYDTQFYNL